MINQSSSFLKKARNTFHHSTQKEDKFVGFAIDSSNHQNSQDRRQQVLIKRKERKSEMDVIRTKPL
jgi:hypothetical protein